MVQKEKLSCNIIYLSKLLSFIKLNRLIIASMATISNYYVKKKLQ